MCPGCKVEKVYSEYHKNRAAKDGLQYHCKDCRRIIEKKSPKKLARDRARYHNNKAQYLNSTYLRMYSISLDEYNLLLEKQNNVCAICKGTCSSGRRLAVDHDHVTNEVRGLLCGNCNTGLGNFKDNIDLLSEAQNYLLRKYDS